MHHLIYELQYGAGEVFLKPFLINWDRGSQAVPFSEPRSQERDGRSPAVVCLWVGGFLANHSDLLHEADLPPATSTPRLIEALYRRHGDRLPEKLSGSLSFVLWDSRRRCLNLVRDRMGTCGLYYQVRGNWLAASDRVGPLLKANGRAEEIDEISVAAHLHDTGPPAGRTFFKNVQSVRPGGAVVVSRGQLQSRDYWSPRLGRTLKLADDAEYAAALRRLLIEVASQYAPEPRLGIALSGGMDSTATAAAVKAGSPSVHLTAFTCVSPEEPSADESAMSQAVCEKLRLPSIEVSSEQCFPMRDGIPVQLDSPFVGAFAEIWDCIFTEAAGAGVRVMLSGVGGDDLFGGRLPTLPDLLLTLRWRALAKEIPGEARRSSCSNLHVIRRRLVGPLVYAYFPWRRRRCLPPHPWLSGRLRGVYREALQAPERPIAALPARVQRLRYLELARTLEACESLTAQGRVHGVEVRHPLFDHRLVDFALRLPSRPALNLGLDKVVLRNAMAGLLPDQHLAQKRKVSPLPIFRRAVAERRVDYVRGLTDGMRSAQLGFVQEEPLRLAVEEFVAGRNLNSAFWPALTLEAWLRRFF